MEGVGDFQVEVIGDWGEEEESAEELATRVLAWFQSQPVPDHRDFRIEAVTQAVRSLSYPRPLSSAPSSLPFQSHMLYLDSASVLRDCCDIEDSVQVSSCDIVLDYKAKKKNEGRDGQLPPPQTPTASLLINPAGPMPQTRAKERPPSPAPLNGEAISINTVSSVNINLANLRGNTGAAHMSSSESLASLASSGVSTDTDEVQWHIVAVTRPSDSFVIALAVMHQRLVSLSIQIINSAKRELKNGRSETGTPLGSPTHSPASPQECPATDTNNATLVFPLPALARQRCSHGLVATSEGRVFAYGGYDRGECLASLEELVLDEDTGLWLQWRPMPPMTEERGRFDAAGTADGRLFAIGGSCGTKDLDTVEVFDPIAELWTPGPRMLFAKSNHGSSPHCLSQKDVIILWGPLRLHSTGEAHLLHRGLERKPGYP